MNQILVTVSIIGLFDINGQAFKWEQSGFQFYRNGGDYLEIRFLKEIGFLRFQGGVHHQTWCQYLSAVLAVTIEIKIPIILETLEIGYSSISIQTVSSCNFRNRHKLPVVTTP